MKHRIVLAVVLLLAVAACGPLARTQAGKDGPRLSFQERSHDFGRIRVSEKPEYRFAFTNTGSRVLEIKDIRLEPVNPGG